MKRYQVFIIAVLMSLCSVIGSASANTIVFMNVPLVQKSDEELQQYLKLCKWEELPTNTKMDARIWTFGADERRCAIQISDKLYTLEDGKVRGCYSFSLLGIIFNGFCFINLIPHFFDYLMCPYYPALYDGLLSNCYRW